MMNTCFTYPIRELAHYQLDLPWTIHQEINCVPELQLVYAIFDQAWQDSIARIDNAERKEARRWFFSKPFTEFCQLIDISPNVIQRFVSNKWRLAWQ